MVKKKKNQIEDVALEVEEDKAVAVKVAIEVVVVGVEVAEEEDSLRETHIIRGIKLLRSFHKGWYDKIISLIFNLFMIIFIYKLKYLFIIQI